ncbi:hypothetical protein LX16_1428 [Stackebrandtia albiflava]|uniref:Uncharacterized protein n=1 Tax=Stackebrandtia albiflava TaxID=406432 RepID=A0A562VCV4_9ACTN|nr:hypothetical protein [Stackebrandtia albiflava]TWJ15714.1 hypothetical protein LX16_1428 [Stackebrandtia albiflava]
MNDDIKNLFQRAVDDEPPAKNLDLDGLEKRGSRALSRRRWGAAGAGAVGVAAVTAVALVLPGALGGAPADGTETPVTLPAAEDGEETTTTQPEFPFPELDPDRKYMWDSGDDEETAATAELTEAFWDHMTTEYSDMGVIDIETGYDELLEPEDFPAMSRSENELYLLKLENDYPYGYSYSDRESSTGYVVPMYGLNPAVGTYGTLWLTFGGEGSPLHHMDLTVHPKGSYDATPMSYPESVSGTPVPPHLLAGCEDVTAKGQAERNWTVDYDCSEATGPNGEHIQQLSSTLITQDGFVSNKMNAVIVTLPNGNAVVVQSSITPNVFGGEHGDVVDITDVEPELDFEELAALALALPQVIVE